MKVITNFNPTVYKGLHFVFDFFIAGTYLSDGTILQIDLDSINNDVNNSWKKKLKTLGELKRGMLVIKGTDWEPAEIYYDYSSKNQLWEELDKRYTTGDKKRTYEITFVLESYFKDKEVRDFLEDIL